MPATCIAFTIALNSCTCWPRPAGGVVGVRREEAEGVVAPVVAQALVEQRGVLDELVHRHQLDRGHAELLQVGGDRRVREAGVRPALLLRHVGVQLGEALDVRLVDEGLVVGDGEAAVALPVEERVDDHAVGHVRGGVVVVLAVLLAEVVGEQRLVPLDLAAGRLGVGVEEQLVGVAAQALGRVPRAVDAVAVALAGLHRRDVAVPHVGVDLGDLELRLDELPGVVGVGLEQAQLDALGDLAEDREVGAAAVERRAEGVRRARPGLRHAHDATGATGVDDSSTPVGGRR